MLLFKKIPENIIKGVNIGDAKPNAADTDGADAKNI